jgi:hypothetical protein
MSFRKLAWSLRNPRKAIEQIREVKALQAYQHEIRAEPLMPAPAVAGLRELLHDAQLMIEYGCGGSTIMAARHGVTVVSVESDHNFADAVLARARGLGLTSITIIKPEFGWTMAWGYPFDRYPTRRNLSRWQRYVDAPWAAIGDALPGLILVDGRFRAACVAKAVLECLKRDIRPPIVIDDFLGRPKYRVIGEIVDIVAVWDRTAVTRVKEGLIPGKAELALSTWIANPD